MSSIENILNKVNFLLNDCDFKPINPKTIGYEYCKNENLWHIIIAIKSYETVDFTDLCRFLKNPNIKCQCLCIGIKNKGTIEEYIYAQGLYQLNNNVNPYSLPVELSVIQKISTADERKSQSVFSTDIDPNNWRYRYIAQIITLCCRKESSEYDSSGQPNRIPDSQIIKNYIFKPEWIHESRDDENYREIQNEIRSLVFSGKKQFQHELEDEDINI